MTDSVRDDRSDRLPQRRSDLEVAEFDTDVVVFDADRKEVHLLEGLTAVVLDACDGQLPVDDLAQQISDGLAIEPTASRAHVDDALSKLAFLNLFQHHVD